LETREKANIEGRPAAAAAISFLLRRKYNLDEYFSFKEEA
jgi:hypothetical protein